MAAFPYRIFTEWSKDDECFVARVPALDVAADGETVEQATHEAVTASVLMLDSLRAHARSIPEPDATASYAGRIALRLPSSLHASVARLASADGVSVNQALVNLIAMGVGRRTA